MNASQTSPSIPPGWKSNDWNRTAALHSPFPRREGGHHRTSAAQLLARACFALALVSD